MSDDRRLEESELTPSELNLLHAERWRALTEHAMLTSMGNAGYHGEEGDYRHITLNIFANRQDVQAGANDERQASCVEYLTELVDCVRKRRDAENPSTTCDDLLLPYFERSADKRMSVRDLAALELKRHMNLSLMEGEEDRWRISADEASPSFLLSIDFMMATPKEQRSTVTTSAEQDFVAWIDTVDDENNSLRVYAFENGTLQFVEQAFFLSTTDVGPKGVATDLKKPTFVFHKTAGYRGCTLTQPGIVFLNRR